MFSPIYQRGVAFYAPTGMSSTIAPSTSFDKEEWVRSLTPEQRDLLRLEIETLDDSWLAYLHDHIIKEEFLGLKRFLAHETASGVPWFPPEEDLYRWSRCTPLHKVKVVILNQGPSRAPYGMLDADGLAFSMRPPHKAFPTGLNIFRAVKNDYPAFTNPQNGRGSLTPWAERGVLLLNIVQTATTNWDSHHHGKGWESFTARIIQIIIQTQPGVVFMVWGTHAQQVVPRIRMPRHLVLRTSHPAPLGAHLGFLTCGHFKRANDWLIAKYGPKAEIDWALEPGNSTISHSEEEPRPLSTYEKSSRKTAAGDAVSDTFSLFIHLPFDIRRDIYIMATPPRVVHVQEYPAPDENAFENFKDYLKATLPHHLTISPYLDPLRLYGHPSLTKNWIDEVRQKTLDRYDFRCPSSTSTQSLRTMPLWLSEHPMIAWQCCRRTQLFSKAPIPPLLHTCQESRGVLTRYGYALTFATHSAPARTWFHYERDNLYLSRKRWKNNDNETLEKQLSTLQFIPGELERVRNLSLSFRLMNQFHEEFEISEIQHSIPGLRTLYCVNSVLDHAARSPRLGDGSSIKKALAKQFNQLARDAPRPHWEIVSADLADFRSKELQWLRKDAMPYVPVTEAYLEDLETGEYSDTSGDEFSDNAPREEPSHEPRDVMQDLVRDFRERLVDWRATQKGEWTIPNVELVNIGTAFLIEELQRERKAYWDRAT